MAAKLHLTVWRSVQLLNLISQAKICLTTKISRAIVNGKGNEIALS
jgi:hypothetical protein